MAYYQPYQNQYYSQMQVPQMVNAPAPAQQPQNQNGLIWVQGEGGAKSYLVAPNATVMLMDSESQRFYLKSSDASGMPLPLRIFEYTEITKAGTAAPAVDLSTYATRAELEAMRDEIKGMLQNVPKQPARTKAVKEDE